MQVHANVLGLSIEHVFLLLTEDLNVVFGLLLLLLLNYLFQILLLLLLMHFQKSGRCQGNLVLLSALALLFVVKGHEVEWFLVLKRTKKARAISTAMTKKATYSFDVDLETIEGVFAPRQDTLLVELDALLLEEVLHGRLCHLAVVRDSVRFHSTLHVLHIILGTGDGFFRELADSLDQILVAPFKHNHAAWENAHVFLVLVE